MKSSDKLNEIEKAIVLLSRTTAVIAVFFIVIIGILISLFFDFNSGKTTMVTSNATKASVSEPSVITVKPITASFDNTWKSPSESSIPASKQGEEILYGKDLIANTAVYLGPKGKVAQLSNGMNCQNCHNAAGTKPWGNNYSAVYSTYPKFRARSGTKESIVKRINDCFERSLNGKPLDSVSREMKAMISYIKWLGKDVKKNEKPEGVGLMKLAYLTRAADTKNGAVIYDAKCVSCHGKNGEGILNIDKNNYTYPPLWGKNSYNDGAGLYRIVNFAGFVKNNMPFGVSYQSPLLTDEESWDVAAYVNSQPRPHKNQIKDYKDIKQKPIDFPFGPYGDSFSEKQHKYGPFDEIAKAKKAITK